MGDALALPFSVSGINSGGYSIVDVFSLGRSEYHYINTSQYDVGCVVSGGFSSACFICPIYFLPLSSTTVRGPAIQSASFTTANVLIVNSDSIYASDESNLSLHIMLFKAP